ncbi:MAG: N-acetylmuramoyl-L-alanine amidase, partial [Oscillospiraceae bacterium]|nr:N-acetylmuramoyl-L-alanine amidase [Oscillospiraceae bacterium]
MEKWKRPVFSATLILAVVYIFVFSVVRANEIIQTSALYDAPPCVIVDAGHGGEDGGTSTASGVRESQINLSLSVRLRDLLRLCGVQVKMIRETDTAIYSENCTTLAQKKVSDLKNRVALVNAIPTAMLVSIHQNYYPQASCKGAQVFYADTEGSEELAQMTQEYLRTHLDSANNRIAKRATSVYLMQNVTCPAILVECGFLSNAHDAQLLLTNEHQIRLAAAICASVSDHISQKGS